MSMHTILLLQSTHNTSGRTYYDFDTVTLALDHVASLYEQKLQRENPQSGQIQYRAEDLFRFIDSYKEFVALVFEPAHQSYLPRDKEWIKDRLLAHFSQQNSAPPISSHQQHHHQQHQKYHQGNRFHNSRRW
ncbi:enhancer of rudimentary-domain-containing protein [Spinellus fusiger]|nr:enhancer of rudimentary-domain-containing protein [Spinellus fusiger]